MRFLSLIAGLVLWIESAHAQSTIAHFDGPSFAVPSSYGSTRSIDFDGDGSAELVFSSTGWRITMDEPPSGGSIGFLVRATGRNGLLGAAQPAGVVIDSQAPAGTSWHSTDAVLAENFWSRNGDIIDGEVVHEGWRGSLGAITHGYLGVRFHARDGLHYGWIRARLPNSALSHRPVQAPGAPYMLFGESPPRIQNVMPGESSPSPRIQIVSFGESSPLILEWAYETRPNTPIITGARPTEPAALAGRYEALLKPAAGSSPASLGWIQAHVTPTGAFSGSVTVEGTRLPVSGILAPDGLARFRPAMTPDLELATGQGPARRSLGFLSMAGTPSGLSGALRDAGNALLASFAGERAPFGRANPVPDELLNLPASGKRTRGVYHVVFAPRETDGSNSPTGYGFARLTLSRSGMAALGGYLADGSRFTASGRLRADRSLACVQWLSGNQGAFGGELAFDPSAADTDLTGADWLWVRPMLRQARNYPDGWPDGVRLDVVGTKHAAPASLDLGQGPVRPNGNVGLEFREGRLLGAKNFAVNVDPSTGLVSRVPAGTRDYTLELSKAGGRFAGRFLHEDGTRPLYQGILLHKGANRGGFGFFLSAGPDIRSGTVTLDPDGP